jgi:hypothetical protein
MHVWVSNYKEIIMATVNKDFKVKHGLIVEGSNATVDGSDIITEDALTGGTQTNVTVTYDAENKVVNFVAESGLADGDTDDLAEGNTNLYYTEARAKTDAAELLTGATKTNITITGDGDGLTITAENGVADSDTDDLTEGSTNLYFTDARAQAAVATDISTAVSDHNDLTTGVHGVSGDVVGTTDSQTLSAKTLKGKTYFVDSNGDGGTNNSIAKDAFSGNFVIQSGTDMQIATVDGDIVLNADGNVYKDSVSTENEIITQGRLDSYLGDNTIDGTGGNTVADRIATAVSDLVDGAPALLDTLNELAAAIGDDESFATTIATDIGTKVSKSGDTMTGALAMGTNKITGLGAPTDDNDAATKKYADDTFVTLEDLPGELDDYVPLTQRAAADGVATLDGDAQVPLTQLEHVTDIIDGLTTADIAEDSGSLYFTNTRAVDALEAVVPNFTAVEVNSLAKQVAATSLSLGSVPVAAYSFAKADYRTAKFIVKIDNGTHNEVTEVLLSLDSSDNIAMTQYAIVGTNGSRGTITADVDGANVLLIVDPVNDSTINVVGTLLA